MPRPEKPINWKRVDELLIAGCYGTEIAGHFDMHPQTFYLRVEDKYKMSFTEYSSEKRCTGDSLIREKQFKKALEGDNVMLVWLGKNRLKQKESPEESTITEQTKEQFNAIMAQLSDLQSSALKRADSNINNEQKS